MTEHIAAVNLWVVFISGIIVLATSIISSVLSVRKWVIAPLTKQIEEERAAREELATKMQTIMGYSPRLDSLELKIGLFWSMIQKSTSELLHRDDTPDVDVLLEKLPNGTLTDAELSLLSDYLREIETSETRPRADRVAAIMLRATIEARKVEPYG